MEVVCGNCKYDGCKDYEDPCKGCRCTEIVGSPAYLNKPLLFESKNDDPVNRPGHYTTGDIECIDAIKGSMSHEEFIGFLKGNAIKYMWRYRHKGKPVEDLKKAEWYLGRLRRLTELVGGK